MTEEISRKDVTILSVYFVLFLVPLASLLLSERNFTVQVCLALFTAAVLGGGAWWLGAQGTYRFKVAALLSACVAVIMAFAVVYSLIFWRSQGSFRLSNELLTENARDEYQRRSAEFLEATRNHYYLTLARARPSAVLEALDKSGVRAEDVGGIGVHLSKSVRIGERELLEHYFYVQTAAQGQFTTTSNLRVLDAESRKSLYTIAQSDSHGIRLTAAQRLGHDLLSAKTDAEVAKALDGLLELAAGERGRQQTVLHNIVTSQPNLEMTHFIYFSAAVMTTVGSNDISPNSQATRMVVIFQSLCAVFFFGYALQLLWPDKGKPAD